MAITNENLENKVHRVKVRLFPNVLNKNGRYVAKTVPESSMNIEDICTTMMTRGSRKGDYETAVNYVRAFMKEAAYNLTDGFSVNFDLFTVYPHLSGTFDSEKSTFDPKRNRLGFRFRVNKMLRDLRSDIGIDILGVMKAPSFIYEFKDIEEEAGSQFFLPENLFVLTGRKIKIEGDDPSCGLYFVPVEAPDEAVKVRRIAENGRSKIIGIAPDTRHALNRLEIRTQYTGNKNTPLKEPRVITSDFTIEAL